MKGFSVFLGQELDNIFESKLDEMYESGFDRIFTSLHIPEEDASLYRDRLVRLGNWTRGKNVSLYADISGEALKSMGFSFSLNDLNELKEMGVTGLRMDYGIKTSVIAETSKIIKVALNASTIDTHVLQELAETGAHFHNLIAWHNYYPRPETGLGKKEFIGKNKWLKEEGFQVAAFVPGDGMLRGPLFEQLPTLETHRYKHPLASAIELTETCFVDDVYIGDPSLDLKTRMQFSLYQKEENLLLYAEIEESPIGRIEGVHQNRPDPARDVFRSSNGRLENKEQIVPQKTIERLKGSITLDNELYGRYQGEMQVVRVDLPADVKVNVVGRVRKKDWPLLRWLGPNQKIEIRNLNNSMNMSGGE